MKVAITGIGVVSALGHGKEPFWNGLVAGVSGIRPLRRCARPNCPGAVGGEVPGLEARTFARSPLGRRIDWVSLMALAATRLAVADAHFEGRLEPDRTGLALGSSFANLNETTQFLDKLFTRGVANPLLFPNLVMNAPLSYVSIELGITGPSAMLTEVELSGEAGLAWGVELVAEGAVDVCLAGGVDELMPLFIDVLHRNGGLAEAARPYDPKARGAIPGEGAAVLVLEPSERARARGARVYAYLSAPGSFAVPAPVHGWPQEAGPLAQGLATIVADADVVVGAASGQPAVDRLEAEVLRLTRHGRPVTVTAPRAAVGDFGAVGALSAAAAALIVHEQLVPPTLGATRVPTEVDIVRERARPSHARVVIVHGLARGGLCRALRLEAA